MTEKFLVEQGLRKCNSVADMASGKGLLLALSLALCAVSALGRAPSWDGKIVMPTNEEEEGEQGTRWAILIAGSAGYWNYRHQVLPIMPVVYHLLRLPNSSQRYFSLSVLVAWYFSFG